MARSKFPEKSAKLRQSNAPVAAALRLLAYRARSEKEVRDRLGKRFSATEVDVVIKKLKDWNFLDDTQFAKQYIESRSRSRPRSRRLIQLELKRKGIVTDYELLATDYELARLALEKKKNLKSRDQTIRFLHSRGFSWEIIQRVLKLPDVS